MQTVLVVFLLKYILAPIINVINNTASDLYEPTKKEKGRS